MRRIYLIGGGMAVALLLIAGGSLLAIQQRVNSGYAVRGRIAGFSDHPRRLLVEHEAIDGYMPAMTMPLTVRDPDELGGLDVGDAIGFRLYANADSSWMAEVERLPDSAVARHPAAATSPGFTKSSEGPALVEGDRVPAFTLSQNQDGQPVQLADYEGQILLLTFIYTRCPLPDYCPLMSQRFATLQDTLPARLHDGNAPDVALLSVSFDPENDTPQVLAGYAARYTDDRSNWTFATGTPEEVQHVTDLFGVFTEQQDGQIMHSLVTVLIGPDGRVRELWRGNDWTLAEVMDDVEHVAEEASPPGESS